MYAETGLMFPYFHNFNSSDVQQFDDFCHSQKFITCPDKLSSSVSDYDVGEVLKAAEGIIQEPMSMICCGEERISPEEVEKEEEFLNDVLYECKDLLASPLSEVISLSWAGKRDEEIPKSMSSDSLNSMDWIQGTQLLNFTQIDFGMRRAYSDGDIKTLSDAKTNLVNYYPLGHPTLITEDRLQKLSRYRNKKTKRNFGRKIKEGFGRQSA